MTTVREGFFVVILCPFGGICAPQYYRTTGLHGCLLGFHVCLGEGSVQA